jgi:hypothetical protein
LEKILIVKAAGGLVQNENKEVLFILGERNDLPKGKLDKGETLEEVGQV